MTACLAAPIAFGLLGTLLPAFGYLPALGGKAFSLQPFRDLLAVPGLATSALLSLAVGVAATTIATLVALLLVAASYGTRAFRRVLRALGVLIAVPHAAAAFGLAMLLAPSGLAVRVLAGPLGIDRPPDYLMPGDPLGLALVAGLVLKEAPFILLVVAAALGQADPVRRMQLARSLGYGRMAGFVMTVWPAVYRQIRWPVLAVAAFSSSVVDVALILGPSRPATLSVRLAGWMADPDLALRFTASAGAVLQLAVTLATIAAWLILERLGAALRGAVAASGLRFRRERALGIAAVLPAVLGAAAAGLGIAALLLWSLAARWTFPALLPSAFTLKTFAGLSVGASGPIFNALALAGLSTGTALLLVVALLETVRRAHRRAGPVRLPPMVTLVLALPLIVPQVSFLFGLQLLALLCDLPPGLLLVAAAHLVFVVPYVAIALADPWFALDSRYEKVARSLGRSGREPFVRVRLALLLRPLLAAGAIGFAVSIGQYLPTLLLGAGRVPTITTEAVALASGGDRRLIGATALLQALPPLAAFGLAALLPALLYRGRRGMRAA